jgi:hypothetical protein
MISTHGRLGVACVLVTAAVISVAACSSGSSSSHVASPGSGGASSSSNGSSASAQSTGDPAQLLDEWATCMRSHGDPAQTDPSIDSSMVIHVTFPPAIEGTLPQAYQESSGYRPCNRYLTAASTALQGGHPLAVQDPAKMVQYSQCMRANGIPDFPDPTAHGLQIQYNPGSDLNPENPIFQKAQKKCASQVGIVQLGGGVQPGFIQMQRQGNGA